MGVGERVGRELDLSQGSEGFPVSGSRGVWESFKSPVVLTGSLPPGSWQMV